MRKPVIAFTMGDPAGIGPEIAVRCIQQYQLKNDAEIVLYGSPAVIEEAIRRYAPGLQVRIRPCGSLSCADFKAGELSAACGLDAYHAVCRAAEDAVAGAIDAMVTCPVNKAAVNLAGIPFTGHTELVAAISGCSDFAMMQSAGPLRVIFVTTHIALAEVSAAITQKRILTTAHLLLQAIREEGIEHPSIAVAAINPHAGENGNMGREDEEIVKPAIAALRESGVSVDGPFPPDTLFIESTRSRYDGIVSMYHDQGHIPFKMLAFDRGVNSTLGIPIIRTSVDHGTAFEIAWQGKADIGSLHAAFSLALIRAKNRIAGRMEAQGNPCNEKDSSQTAL